MNMNLHPSRYGFIHRRRRSCAVCLTLFAILLLLTVFSAPLRIALSGPGIAAREEISPTVNYLLFLLSFLSYILSIVLLRARFTLHDLRNLTLLFSLLVAVVLGYAISGFGPNRPSVLFLCTWTMLILSTYSIFRFSEVRGQSFSQILICTYLLACGLTVLLAYYFYTRGLIEYTLSPTFRLDRPQIGGSLLNSTEMSNILACVLLLIPGVWANCGRTGHKLLVVAASVPVFFLFIVMGSLGSFISGICVLFLLFLLQRPLRQWFKILPVAIVALLLLSLLIVLSDSTRLALTESYDAIVGKVHTDRRSGDYSLLLALINANPYTGYGYNYVFDTYGVYPHQNALGLWAELGPIPMCAYLAIFCVFILYGKQTRMLMARAGHRENAIIVAECFCMIVLFLHLKGLVHDTWYDKSLWLYSGSVLGLTYNRTCKEQLS